MRRYFRECGLGLAILIGLIITLFIIRASMKRPSVAVSENMKPAVDIYVSAWNFWQPYFTEPVERVIFVFQDGRAACFTSYLDLAVEGTEALFMQQLAKWGLNPADCLVIIHNHLYTFQFSIRDRRFCTWFRAKGFKGRFLLFRPSRTVAELEEE